MASTNGAMKRSDLDRMASAFRPICDVVKDVWRGDGHVVICGWCRRCVACSPTRQLAVKAADDHERHHLT